MSKGKILIVEDWAITALEIERSLAKMGYEVTEITNSYESALKSIEKEKPDAILLDIGLKGKKDGIELAQKIDASIPIVYLTSSQDEETMIRAAYTNPSAYLSKPFRREELRSNLLIALNKAHTQNNLEAIGYGYSYDYTTKNIYHDTKPIYLSANEKLLLQIFVESKNKIIPADIIKERIWGVDAVIAENSLRTLLYRLRNKLEHLPIETIPSFGYKLYIKEE
ncbi:MAG: response regulator [Campylobacterales bacterium]|nr:response regulator [Campylobacterales bacterium]